MFTNKNTTILRLCPCDDVILPLDFLCSSSGDLGIYKKQKVT